MLGLTFKVNVHFFTNLQLDYSQSKSHASILGIDCKFKNKLMILMEDNCLFLFNLKKMESDNKKEDEIG